MGPAEAVVHVTADLPVNPFQFGGNNMALEPPSGLEPSVLAHCVETPDSNRIEDTSPKATPATVLQARFRLAGVSPELAVRHIECQSDFTFAEINELVHIEYKLCPTLAIVFIFHGRVLPTHATIAGLGYNPKTDTITVMAVCGVGRKK